MQKLIAGLMSALLFSTSAIAGNVPPENQAAVDAIISEYQEQCNAAQGEFRNINADMDQPLVGALSLADDAVYTIPIDISGKSATVLYQEFRCTNIGYAWCGTGGCGFYIIVDGVIFARQVSFRPQSVTISTPIGERVVLIYPLQGYNCQTASGGTAYGTDPCYETATWDTDRNTFFTQKGSLEKWDFSLP